MTRKETARRRRQDMQDKYSIRIQGGKAGLVEATSRMDINEFRVFATMLTMVLPEDEDFTEYEIRVQEIIKLFSLNKDGRYYDIIRDAAQRLMDRKFVIYEVKEDGEEYKTTIHLIDETSEPVRAQAQTHIRLRFNPKLKPYLLQLKREYLTIDVRNIVDIHSPYSIKMYMVLKHQQKLGNEKARYTLERLRQILAIEEEEYPLYGNFKQKVLRKAVDDINRHTDLKINTIEEEKTGRAVSSVVFTLEEQDKIYLKPLEEKTILRRKGPKKPDGEVIVVEMDGSQGPEILSAQQADLLHELLPKVQAHGITEATLAKWLVQLPAEQVRLGVAYVLHELQTGKPIGNIGGYLHRMVTDPSLYSAFVQARESQKVQNQRILDQKNRQEEEVSLERKRQELSERIDGERKAALQQLILGQEAVHTALLQRMKQLAENEHAGFLQKWTWDKYLESGYTEDATKEQFLQALETCGMSFFLTVWQLTNEVTPELRVAISSKFAEEARLLNLDIDY